MGGSGGGSYTGWSSEKLTEVVREESAKSAGQFEVNLAGFLSNLLAGFGRDTVLVRERLDQAKAALGEETEDSFDELFGGSVAKHTYVDGLSDVDTLLVINDSKFEDHTPKKILERIESILREHLSKNVVVDHGAMAVSITYPDGMVIQLLPALRTETGLRVPSARKMGGPISIPMGSGGLLQTSTTNAVESWCPPLSWRRPLSRTCPSNTS